MKTAIITGGGSGLGKELGKLLSQQGYHILLLGRTEDRLKEAGTEIEHIGGQVSYSTLDIRSTHDIHQFCRDHLNDRKVELLIHNAGVGYFGPFEESSDDELISMFETNALGPIRLTKALLPKLEQESTIINIISTAGLRGKKNESLYVASKFALRGFGESLQKEYEATDLRIVNAYMGGMDTPFWENSDHISDPSRLRSPKEVAETIVNEFQEKDEIVIESKK
ncbi:SDR family NAD(P)-dependent oxidoreductase [Rossellomorea vietnamensis]|uniref:SDR family NAD(P)-dependent oxidoreductase n=1 Tax=Rossellomorea vietnamensis TaxID=218284 RepID=A0A6I6UGX2_9BACI|nr:SDR family oxidoreductase [Rossellomorea vietnamensis]QHE60757.1 SDR family NAD(P)-dependent oxidoreductase [Rossellomorea vietnamensis]